MGEIEPKLTDGRDRGGDAVVGVREEEALFLPPCRPWLSGRLVLMLMMNHKYERNRINEVQSGASGSRGRTEAPCEEPSRGTAG